MVKKVALSAGEIKILKNIFKNVGVVIFFGSRVKGINKKYSDLDVCIKNRIAPIKIELIREQLENSDLPFRVDLIEYSSIDKTFRKIIDKEGIVFPNKK